MSTANILDDLIGLDGTAVTVLKRVKEFVHNHQHAEIKLKGVTVLAGKCLDGQMQLNGNYIWQVGAFEDVISTEEKEDLEECYLPDHMRMEVLGKVKHIGRGIDFILLMCEDAKVYAYTEDELHLVAESSKQLSDEGITFPSKEVYHYGQAFEDMTEEELEEVRQSEEMAIAKAKHRTEAKKWEEPKEKTFSPVEDCHNRAKNTNNACRPIGGKRRRKNKSCSNGLQKEEIQPAL